MNNNEIEFEYLNDLEAETPKKDRSWLVNGLLLILKVCGYVLYGLICGLCGLIEIIATCFLLTSFKPKKRKKRR